VDSLERGGAGCPLCDTRAPLRLSSGLDYYRDAPAEPPAPEPKRAPRKGQLF
jgi:hypothetical protein